MTCFFSSLSFFVKLKLLGPCLVGFQFDSHLKEADPQNLFL